MAGTNSIWGWNGFDLFNPATWIPTFGNWCGPGWSGGVRTDVITQAMIDGGAVISNKRKY